MISKPEDDEQINEWRADLGTEAVLAAARQTGVADNDTVEAAIVDVLAYIAHTCDRYGLDPDALFARAIRSYEGDFEDGPQVEQIADGTSVSFEEGEDDDEDD